MTSAAVKQAGRTSWPISQILDVGATSVVLGLVDGGLAALHPHWAAAAMAIVVVAAAGIFVRVLGWRVGLAVLLIVTCLIDRNTFPVDGVNIRPEQIAGILTLLTFGALALRSKRDLHIRPDRIELALLAWFAVALASSVLSAPHRAASVKILALLMLSSLALFLPRRLVADRSEDLERVIGWALLAFAFEGVYASLMYYIHVFGPTIAISLNSATGHLNAYGTLWEPNALGAISGAAAVAWAFLGPRYFSHSWIGVAICLTACVASFTRAVWLAVIFVIVLSLLTPVRRRIDLRNLGLGVLSASPFLAWIFVSDRLGNYSVKGLSNSVGNAADILGRLYQFGPALADLKRKPILGAGIDTFGQLHILEGKPEHLGNLELLVLHDTGVLGLLVFAAFGAGIVVAAWRCRENPIVLGLAAMDLVILIANQATEALELMITWLMIGLLLAAIDAAKQVSPPSSVRTGRYTGS